MKHTNLSVLIPFAAFQILAVSGFAQDVRSYDGSGNNLANPSLGQTGSQLSRSSAGAVYADGLGAIIDRGNSRAISNLVSVQTAPENSNARNLSSMFWQWGQFIDHDFALVDEGTESAGFAIPRWDSTFDPTGTGSASMPFNRSQYTGGVTTPRQQSNALTHWMDASMVYGSDAARANELRTHSGGLLKSGPGDMLPYNINGIPNGGGTGSNMYMGGDIRVNEQSGLIAMHTVFMREHNRQAGLIAAANPTLTDEQIYQRARAIVAGEIQSITYNEWLPTLLGENRLSEYSGYRPEVDPSIRTEFSTAAFRIGHTLLNTELKRYNADGSIYFGGHLTLSQSFFNPSTVNLGDQLDALIRGFAWQQANEIDTQVIGGVRNLLFGGTNGRDLVALNIQRGRDHGNPSYVALREAYGLPPLLSFADITSDPNLMAALQNAYGSIENIDAFIGLLAEDHAVNASVGETMIAIFADQFERLRDGDRFWYGVDPSLTQADREAIDAITLADILRLNTGADEIQDQVFQFTGIPAPGAGALLACAGVAAFRRRRA